MQLVKSNENEPDTRDVFTTTIAQAEEFIARLDADDPMRHRFVRARTEAMWRCGRPHLTLVPTDEEA